LAKPGIQNFLNRAASTTDEMVMRVVRASQLVVQRSVHKLNPPEDAALLQEGEGSVNRGP
jgi:hypothetical protein